MRIRGRAVTELTIPDLQALIDAKTPESRVLEYKADIPGGKDEDKREFLADVTALANTAGGAILYGVETQRDDTGKDTGIPTGLCGVTAANIDAEKLRLQNMLRDGVNPALTRVAFVPVEVPGARGPVIALGVARGLILPHMIGFQRSGKVFRRSDSDKYQVDVNELRRMILEGEDWTREAETFRRERVRSVRSGETVPNLATNASVVLHVLPLGRLSELHDLRPFADALSLYLGPPRVDGWDNRWNLDGFLIYSQTGSYGDAARTCNGYVQWLRSGGVEVYSNRFYYKADGADTMVDGARVGQFVREYTGQVIAFMRGQIGLDAPFVVFLSVVRIKGAHLSNTESMYGGAKGPFVQDALLLPAVVLEDADTDINAVLQPVLDMLWQAAGWPGAPIPRSAQPTA